MALALRFISGKYQGGEFPLQEDREVVVGRSSELDMVLVEEMVSRKHARMILRDGRLEIEDLGSTNGTFVNGERITRTTVGRGDRILIGSNILRVVSTSSEEPAAKPSSISSSNRRAVRRPPGEPSSEARMSGELQEIPLPDLLQLFGTSKKDGVLLIDTLTAIGRVVLKQGQVHYAEICTAQGEIIPMPPAKAIYRILTWENGLFELDPPNAKHYDKPLDLSAQAVLMEGFRQKDEYALLQVRLPDLHAGLQLKLPLEPALSKLDIAELDVLQAAVNKGSLEGVLDASPHSDLATAQALVKLLEAGYLGIVQD
jgi:pSer/pThr/pTyr-binding forkhead associated (FHA) protein